MVKLKKTTKFIFISFALLLGCLLTYKMIANSTSKESYLPIPIAMSMDDNYVYPTIVSISSIMKNKNTNTNYSFYIMHPQNLNDQNKYKIKSLEKKYNGCNIKFIDMKGHYDDARIDSHISTPTYYRLSLSELLPDLDKIIWLDGDTLTFHDLSEMFNITMNGYYYKGFLDDNVNGLNDFGVYNDHYICAGVMLINLKELRLDNMVEKFQEFIKENNDRLVQHDQTVINLMCMDKIGVLPPQFGVFNCINNNVDYYVNNLVSKERYSFDQVKKALNDPYILHCVSKPWRNFTALGADKWWEYAKQTDYFKEIQDKYPQPALTTGTS